MDVEFYFENNCIGCIKHQKSAKVVLSNLELYKKNIDNNIFYSNSFYYNFENIDNNCWRIIDVVLDQNNKNIKFYLKKKNKIMSLKDYSLKEERGTHSFLKRGSLVEVDFGFYKSIMNTDSFEIEHNVEFLDKLMFGEMHKRRPCVVLSSHKDLIQIIPLSTKINGNNIKIDLENIEDVNAFYKAKSSYILPSMIQTVSARRVYPFIDSSNKRTSQNFQKFYLNKVDLEKIEKTLSLKFNPYLNKEINNIKKENEKNKKSIINLKDDINLLEELKNMVIEDFEINENSLKKIIEKYKSIR